MPLPGRILCAQTCSRSADIRFFSPTFHHELKIKSSVLTRVRKMPALL